MGYKNITAGEKKAIAIAARFIKSEGKGTPGIEIIFNFEEPNTGTQESLNWVGWLSPNAKENTMDTLVNVLDCNGNVDQLDEKGVFTDPDFINYKKEVELVVELEIALDKDGKQKLDNITFDPIKYPRVKWVNNVGGSLYAACAPEVVKSELANVGFRANFLALTKGKQKNQPPMNPVNIEDLPFD